MQRIADTLNPATIDAVFRKWLGRLPHPFTPAHRTAGYGYQLSILQAEFALTQVLDRPVTGQMVSLLETACLRWQRSLPIGFAHVNSTVTSYPGFPICLLRTHGYYTCASRLRPVF